MLARAQSGNARLNRFLAPGRIDVGFRYGGHRARVHVLMGKYADLPISFADACLVAPAERVPEPVVLTVDTDLTVYQMSRRRRVELIIL